MRSSSKPVDVDVRVAVEDHLGALRAEQIREIVGLFLRVHHERAAAEQRPRIEPAQVIAEVDDLADDQEAGADRLSPSSCSTSELSVPVMVRCDESVPLQDDRRRLVRRSSVLDERVSIFGSCCGPAYDTIVPSSVASAVQSILAFSRPSSSWPRTNVTRVAAARIGDGNAGIRGGADRMRHARHHFVAHALLVQEQRLFAALIEQKRIAPLQSRHGLAFARLFGEQVTDGVLIARLGRGAADVDALGVFRRDRRADRDARGDRRSRRRPAAGSGSRAK